MFRYSKTINFLIISAKFGNTLFKNQVTHDMTMIAEIRGKIPEINVYEIDFLFLFRIKRKLLIN